MIVIETNNEKYILNMSEIASVNTSSYKDEHDIIIRLTASFNDNHRASVLIRTSCKHEQKRVMDELAETVKVGK